METMSNEEETNKDFLIKTEEVCKRLKISESKFFKKKSEGQIGPMPVKWGNRTLRWNPNEFACWCDFGCPNRERWQPIWQQIQQQKWGTKN
jgi:predicted DNA-binding transcriptional regulator AlpA